MECSRTPLVAGNWKMNGDLQLVDSFVNELKIDSGVDIVICPPACFIAKFENAQFSIGAQNASQFDKGAYTGEQSFDMLKSLGVTHVVLGHSERREQHGETNDVVALKTKACLDAGMTPILCIGESLETRQSGDLFAFLKGQIDAVLEACGTQAMPTLVIAYEPIWAIGTGVTASPEQAQEVHAFIRSELSQLDAEKASKTRILYGGSMNAKNASELLAQNDIDGGLIGGASLKIEDFTTICNAAG
ncbi:triose-phosphate isomerase [Glaciecola sp. KUL10]|uniref:triose-phosphate isomerase n=1 Tax=Glaciecola sp. (strain KUL10) TaxID=2161813 RepID=UPI000D7838CC|nr:triose-phosphate isomerase [Glaciecola sp. KUL10]GBL03283.1 triosephosphate isomerase [Glaciecola sp. KUL10]